MIEGFIPLYPDYFLQPVAPLSVARASPGCWTAKDGQVWFYGFDGTLIGVRWVDSSHWRLVTQAEFLAVLPALEPVIMELLL